MPRRGILVRLQFKKFKRMILKVFSRLVLYEKNVQKLHFFLGFFFMPSIQEVLVILFVAAVLFSAKVPQFARRFGRSLFLTKQGFKETQEELHALDAKNKPDADAKR